MSWLDRVLNTVWRDQLTGLHLEEPSPRAFIVSCEPARSLRALPLLVPQPAVLYCEDTTDRAVEVWLRKHAMASPPDKVRVGTVIPSPNCYHVALEPELVEQLARIVEDRGVALPSIHVHVYAEHRVLVEWHDAFLDDPVLLSRSLPEERVQAFVTATGARPVKV